MYPYPYAGAPPPKKSSGCLTALIVGGVISLVAGGGCLGIVLLGARNAPAQRAKENEALKAEQDRQAREKADLDAKFRKQCKLGDAGAVFPIYDDDLRTQCHAEVAKSLKVPGSGDFPYREDSSRGMTSDDGCDRIFSSYVDAQNAFGVKVRTQYDCKYDPRTSLISVTTR